MQLSLVFIVATLFALAPCGSYQLAKSEEFSTTGALESIQTEEIRKHTEILADDAFEGREAGKAGGFAAATYIIKALKQHEIAPAGVDGGYFQPFGGYRNILAAIPGKDPALAEEYVLLSAHYDHVGYGSKKSSKGPIGTVHNGADDNASGVSALLELAEALQQHHSQLRRTVLLVFWDAEEKGLLGSKHWLKKPTVDLQSVRLMVNIDMIGRLRKDLSLYGTRTMPGLRAAWSRANSSNGLTLRFPWEVVNNSDHYEFFLRQIPIAMVHTGLHDDYHSPSDDVELLNLDGIEAATELLLNFVVDVANEDELPGFRNQSMIEGKREQKYYERPFRNQQRRLGLTVKTREMDAGLLIDSVFVGSPANEAGLAPGQIVLEANGQAMVKPQDLREQIFVSDQTIALKLQTNRGDRTLDVTLTGKRQRIGLSWRTNDAEPGVIMLSGVRPGSLAHAAGLKRFDRVHAIDGIDKLDSETFRGLMNGEKHTLNLTIERRGQISSKTMRLGREPVAGR